MAEPHDAIAPGPIGILSALPEETALLLESLSDPQPRPGRALDVWAGELDGVPLVLADAGVGKVNAASTATLLLERFSCSALVLSGVAGGVGDELAIGDIVLASRVVDVDYGRWTDAGRIAYQPGALPLPEIEPGDPGYRLDPDLRAAIETRLESIAGHGAGGVTHAPGRQTQGVGPVRQEPLRLALGTVLSGDAFLASAAVRDELAARWSALAIEMEGSAVCGVAERFGLPWLVVRALSDRAGESASTDFSAFLGAAAARSATVVRDLLPLLASVAAARGPR